MRLTWAHPEDLVAHALVAGAEFGKDAAALGDLAGRWQAMGGSLDPAVAGASDLTPELRNEARALLDERVGVEEFDPEPLGEGRTHGGLARPGRAGEDDEGPVDGLTPPGRLPAHHDLIPSGTAAR